MAFSSDCNLAVRPFTQTLHMLNNTIECNKSMTNTVDIIAQLQLFCKSKMRTNAFFLSYSISKNTLTMSSFTFETLPDEILMIIFQYCDNIFNILQTFLGLYQHLN